jgi:hypothetical protein
MLIEWPKRDSVTAPNALGSIQGDSLSLATVEAMLADFNQRFPEKLDTHIFASYRGIDVITYLIPPSRVASFFHDPSRFAGMLVMHDAEVPDNEIHIGRMVDGKKVITKIVKLWEPKAQVNALIVAEDCKV